MPHDVFDGTGDYEDPPSTAEDREVECYYLLFHTPVVEPEWVGGGGFSSLAEARSAAESRLGLIEWEE